MYEQSLTNTGKSDFLRVLGYEGKEDVWGSGRGVVGFNLLLFLGIASCLAAQFRRMMAPTRC